MPAESKLRAYIQKTREIIASDDFTLGLTEDQKRQVIDGFKKRIAELSAAESDAFKQEAENILATDEYEKAQRDRENARGASDGATVLNALVRGGVSLPTNAAALTAQAADMAGLKDTAMLLDQYAKDTDYDAEQMFPRAAEGSGYPIRILEAAGENAPAMLATGFGTKALLSGVGRLGVTSNRAAKTLEVLGTAAGMSVPELRKDSVQTNRYGSVMPLENPSAVLAGAIPHALIETGMGVTPLGLVSGADKAGLFKKEFSELLARYQRRYGNRAASRLLLDRLMTETPLGEGMEEVLQNPVGAFTRNLANNDLSTAIQKTGDEITKPGYLGQLGEEFIIGTGVGAVYSGAKALIDNKINDPKTPVTEKQQLAMTKERLQIENQARLQLPYTGDASAVLPDGSPITDVPGVAARDPRSRNIVSILPDGTPIYDDVDPRLTSPALVSPTALPQPATPGLLPPPPSAVELGNMFLRAHARGDQSGSLALRDYAESRSNTPPRARVEPLKGGEYDRMTVRVDGVQIPTENRTLLRGNSEAASRLEKKLPQQQPSVTLPQKSEAGDQADKKQWYIDADDMPVYTVKSDATGYRGPYSKQEIKDLTEVDPSTLTEKNYGKEATLARRERDVTKNGYKVESYQGGFRVLDPEGKQYSWHTSKQAADSKATDLNSGKAAPVVAPKAEPKAETKPVEPQQTTRITSENAEALANAQRLRKSAASLLEQAQADLNRDRRTNTARRARMAAGATDDAANREAFAKTMNNLADAMERGEVRYLKNVKSRPDLILFKNELTAARRRYARKNDLTYDQEQKIETTEDIIRVGAEFNRPHPYGDWFDHAARELEAIQGMKPAAAYIEKLGRGNRSRNVSLSDDAIGKILDIKKTMAKKGVKPPYQFARILETVEDYQKLRAAGIKSDSDLADALIEYRNLEAGKKQESPLVKAERELIGKKFEGFDFFPTPPALAERMARELDIKPGMKVLEPSAGKGDLADAVKAAQPEADVKVIEPLSDLREILTMKNHEVIDTNFENFETDQKFDRIIMNPPFSKNRDIRHVRKAYELLAPGGKMIAIMGNHSAFANDKESVEFRDWLDAVGGTSESLGQVFAGKDAFRQTGVNSQLVTIEKPAGAGAKTTSNRKHSYSNTDVAVPKIVANKMLDLGKAIPVREIYTDKDDPSYGLETRPHITVRYGLSTDNPADLRKLSDLPPITVEMGEVSIFETDKYDVVKVDIESEGLRAANKKVGELVDVPGETYKDYKPHATIAYVKKGEGKKYIGNKSLLGQTFEIDEINLVDRNGEEHPIKLTGKPVETRVRTAPGKAEVSGQTVETPPAVSDLVKPEEKDFESATDYLKALTVWREKTGNLTAAEVKRRDRALRFADRAAKTGQKASGLFRQADKISERFYMGQPILVGHHSERGARAAQNRMHNKMDAALKEEKKAEYYSQRAESAEKNKSISSADEDAIVKLKAKLETLSKVQERMKQANKVVKAAKLSDAEKITKLQEQGFSEAKAKNLLEKDFAGRVGFPAYALQNNNAEMSRLKKRIEELSVKQSQQTQKIEFDGGEIVDNVAENRLQIFFDSKPDEATREKLKSNGFRWAPSAGAWQMHRSTWANRKAESITGAKIPAAQPVQAATAEDQYYNDPAEKSEQQDKDTAEKELVPELTLYKGDGVTFQYPDGREFTATVEDATPRTIDGTPDQIYIQVDANNALRYIPKSWVKRLSGMKGLERRRVESQQAEAATEDARRTGKPILQQQIDAIRVAYEKYGKQDPKQRGFIGALKKTLAPLGIAEWKINSAVESARNENARRNSATMTGITDDQVIKQLADAGDLAKPGQIAAPVKTVKSPAKSTPAPVRPKFEPTPYPTTPGATSLTPQEWEAKNQALSEGKVFSKVIDFNELFKTFNKKNKDVKIKFEDIDTGRRDKENNPITATGVVVRRGKYKSGELEFDRATQSFVGTQNVKNVAAELTEMYKDFRPSITAEKAPDVKTSLPAAFKSPPDVTDLWGRAPSSAVKFDFTQYDDGYSPDSNAWVVVGGKAPANRGDITRVNATPITRTISDYAVDLSAPPVIKLPMMSRRNNIDNTVVYLVTDGKDAARLIIGESVSAVMPVTDGTVNAEKAVYFLYDTLREIQSVVGEISLATINTRKAEISSRPVGQFVAKDGQRVILLTAAEPAQIRERKEQGRPLFSIEYLVARLGVRIVRAGYKLIRSGAAKFNTWARAMWKQFGDAIKKHLRNLWTGLDSFNKHLGRTGAISGRSSGLKNSKPGQTSPAPGKSATEPKQMVTSRGLVWKRVDKDTYELELTDPNTGKTSVVETIRRPKGTDNIWNVDNWTTFDNKGTGSGSFTSLKVAKAAIKQHARDAFNQKIYRDNAVIKDRQRDETLKKKRERGLEQDKVRDEREAKQKAEKKRKAQEYFNEKKAGPDSEPEKPKTWRDYTKNFIEKAEEVLFDMWAPVRRLQESILKKHDLKELQDDLNLYQKLEVMSGRIEAGTRIFKSKYFDPIEKYLVENKIDYKAFNRFLAVMHAEERNKAVAERNETFRITGQPGSGISNEQAAKEIGAHKKNGTFDKFMKAAELTYKLNNALLDEQVRYGLLSQEQRDAYRRYKNYTPMKSPPDQGLILDRTALGRRSEATDQLAYIKAAIEAVFRRGERRGVIGAAMRLFEKFPDQKLYREFEPPKVQYIDKQTGKVRLRTDMSKLYSNPAVIWMKEPGTGVMKAFEIKDTALASAINRQFTGSSVEQTAFRFFAGVNRFLAGVSTAYNPEFIFTNLLRDVQQGAASVGVNLPDGSVKKFIDNLSRAKRAIADARAGKITDDTKALEEFQLAGGKTGYSEFSRLEDAAEDLERKISEAQAGGRWYKTKQSFNSVREWIAYWNDATETRTRFAGYLTAKEAGLSTQKSAAFAKNMTVNFNKKGTWAPVFNALYLFSSASLGGSLVTAGIINRARKTPKGRAMLAGAVGLGFVMELLNRGLAGDDDDDDEGVNYYDKVPDYIKDSNYVFMIPGTKGKYLAVPMPYGLNVLPAIGRNMAASMFGAQSFADGAGNVIGAVANSFNPLGDDNRGLFSLATVTPTAVKPFLDIATNTTWTGRKLRPDQPAFSSKVARSELYFEQNSKILREVTKTLNELTGGDRYTSGFASFSPADVEHLIESYLGGVGRFASRGLDTLARPLAGEAPEPGNIPILRRFGGGATDYSTWQTFKENAETVEDFERARRERDTGYLKSNRHLLSAVALYKSVGKRITAIRKRSGLSEAEKQKLVLTAQKSFNKKFKEINDKALSKN